MTNNEVIKIIENERKCVCRANICNRHCYTCDLVMKDTDIIEAYDKVLNLLKYNSKYRKGLKRFKYKYLFLKNNIKQAMKEIGNLADSDAYGDYQLGFNYGLMSAYTVLKRYFNKRT